MEKRKETEKKCNHSIRSKWKRVMAVALSVLMVTSVIDYSGLVNVNAQTESDAKIVTAFAELPEDICNQQIAEGVNEEDINLPDILNVTVKSFVQENVDAVVESVEDNTQGVPEVAADETTVKMAEESTETNTQESTTTVSPEETSAENADDSTLENEVQNNESDQKETVETVTVESSDNYAAPTSQSVETVIQDTTEAETKTKEVIEDITLENITWKINATASASDTFDSTSAGAVYIYEPVLPEGYSVAEGVSLPQIKVEIIEKEENNGTFQESKTIDGIEIMVKADAGVFPEGALLNVRKIVDDNEQGKIEEAVKEEVGTEEEAKTVEELISFDITITDAEGNELQPDTSKGEVKVSFAQLPMVTEDTAPTQELKVFHMDDSLSEAKGLDTTVNQETESVEATAEHFSVYTVAQLTDEIKENVEAEIKAADGTLAYYDTIEEAITAAQSMSGSTVTLLKDVQTESFFTVSSGTFTIDLNGKTWNCTYVYGMALKVQGSAGSQVAITFKDSAGGGSFTTDGSYSIYLMNGYASVVFEGGNYTGINYSYDNVGDALGTGYVYRNNSDGSVVTDTSGYTISNVTVTPAPVKITAQPEDTVVAPGYSEAPTFAVTAETVPADSGEAISYQWYKDSTAIDSATSASYTVEPGLLEGNYTYYCAVTCDGYTVNSDNATLYVASAEGNYTVTASNGITLSYPTLETAITAAKSKPNSTVKLLADATTASQVEVSTGTFTIDLNGKTWACTGGLWLKYGSNVTLKDSAGGGVMTRATSITICVSDAILTVESGTYKNTSYQTGGGTPTAVLFVNTGDAGSVTIRGGRFESSDPVGRAAYFQQANVDISGGYFGTMSVYFESCKSVALSGGEYCYITIDNFPVGSLLASGYGFKNKSDNTWVNNLGRNGYSYNDLANYFLSKPITVQPLPVQITAQPQATSATYGYTSATMSVTAAKTSAAPEGSSISYQWYRVKSGDETSDTALGTTATQTLPTGLDAGTHSFYCVVTCDGYILNSQSATFTVEQKDISASTLALDIPEGGYTYDKTAKTPAVTLTLDGHTLALGTDYILDYMDNTDAGTASVTITGQGNYTGTKGGTFNIKKATASITLEIKGAGADDEIVYGSAVTYTVRITGVDGAALTNASIVSVYCVNGGNPVGYVMEYNTEKGSYFISQTNFINVSPGTYPFYAIAVFPEGSDTDKNYVLGEENEIISEEISKDVQKADTSVAFDSSYTGNYYYTGSPVSNPTVSDLSIIGASYSNVVFTWYDQTSTKLDTPPTLPGSYILAVSIPENDYFKSSSNTKSVTIGSYDGTVTVAYNGSTTKADWYTGDVQISADGYTVGDSADGTFAESYLLSGEGEVSKTLYFKENGTGYITDGKSVSVSIDKTAPAFSADTDGITISDNNWKGFLNNITFGHFFKENKDVSISATDSGSGVDKYYYYIDTGSTTVKTAEELNGLSFTEGSSFSITDENKYIIYAYAVDHAGNKSAYICTDGIVIDKTAPTVTLTAPTGSDLGDVSGAAKVKMDETGIISYVIKTTEQSGITAQNILDSTEKNTVSVTDGQADTNLEVALSGLTANTTYYMYAVGTDSAQNNGSVVSTSFTTTTTQPVFAENPTITGTYGQQVKDMAVSQVSSTNGVAGSWSVSSTDIPSVGTAATYDVVFTPNDAVQYATVTRNIVPTVQPKSLTAEGVSIGEVSGTYTYDGTAKTPTVMVTDSLAAITTSDFEYSYSNNTNAGTATATVTITAKGNYTGSVSRTFTIAKAPAPSITYPTASGITYGQKLSASALSFSSTEYGTFAWTNSNAVPTVSNSGYEVTFTPNANTTANYDAITGTTHTVAITVSKATPAVTVNAVVSDDAGSRKATLTATVTGAGDGENPTGAVKFVNSTSGSDEDIVGATAVTITGGKATYTWTGLASQIYKVKAVYNGSGNYNTATSTELSFDTNKQNQAALSMESIGTKTYGDGTFTLSATGGNGGGAVTFESSDPTIVSIAGTTATIHKAGTVTITATKAADSTYNEATASVSLTVGKKALTIKANDQLNIIKGAAMPTLTYIATGLVGSDTFTSPTLSTTATDTNTIGEYDITISGGTLANADSYAVTYTNGKLTVVNATYTVTVTNGTGSGSYSEGQTVTITADSRGGYTFSGWSSSDGVTFANSTTSTTTFTMPDKAVTVTANYSKKSSGDSGNSNGGSTTNNTNSNKDTTNANQSNVGESTVIGTGANQNTTGTTQGETSQKTVKSSQNDENKPYLAGDEEKSGWEAIMTEIKEISDQESQEPGRIMVEMNGGTTIPANVIATLQGKNLNLVLDMGDGITWTINGMDVSEDALLDIDLGVTKKTSVIPEDVVNRIRGENRSVQIELAHNGAFGFKATLTIAFEKGEVGKFANLFYYNEETGKLEYMESTQVEEDGKATLTFVHASAYTIVLSNVAMDESAVDSLTETENQTEDSTKADSTEVQVTEETSGNMMVFWILLGIIVVVVIGGTTIYMRRKKDNKEENEV
ncbi:hypothetical protein DS742_22710 [Lacrimispora amygdalina]|uniref:Ig-like domain-containing protein n=1 Tax=Lacrimispora amygdalina TaxID=253257 RepID=A0A3E2N6F4_9FIRM|nr:MBG domain-containing protein [Clostridium indicum]RFZ76575.1 hypothetical protein DS742_22710 [Clostridium indicum]